MKPDSTHNVKLETITPDMARYWLEENRRNRPVKDMVVRRYAEAIKADQWEVNGGTIKFASNGDLLDGQHRLRAVIQSGIAIQSYIIRDLPHKVFDIIDTGANRSISDVLALEGEENCHGLGPVLRMLYIEDQLGSVRELNAKLARVVTNRDLMETLEKHPNIRNSINYVGGIRDLNSILSISLATYCHYHFSKIQSHHADGFFVRLPKITEYVEDDPVIVLRTRLSGIRRSSTAGRLESIALTIKAWNAYRQQKVIRSLQWLMTEEFPVAA